MDTGIHILYIIYIIYNCCLNKFRYIRVWKYVSKLPKQIKTRYIEILKMISRYNTTLNKNRLNRLRAHSGKIFVFCF